MSEPLKLTILMPCLNEAETIARCIEKAKTGLQRAGVPGEILIADNGSTDGSQAIAEQLGARVVAVKEKGYIATDAKGKSKLVAGLKKDPKRVAANEARKVKNPKPKGRQKGEVRAAQ